MGGDHKKERMNKKKKKNIAAINHGVAEFLSRSPHFSHALL